jgi:signal transduction histidine kinase
MPTPDRAAAMHDLAERDRAIGGGHRSANAGAPDRNANAGSSPADDDARPAPPGRRRTIRTMLVRAAGAWVVPTWIFVAVGILGFYRHERAQIAESTISIARALMSAIDRDLGGTAAAAQVLALSPYLAADDFAAFHRQASELVPLFGEGVNIVLTDASGRQLVNTLVPYGEVLPSPNLANQRKVIATGRPSISDVFIGPVAKRAVMALGVPVFRGDAPKYTLSVSVFPERLNELLLRQRLPPNWMAVVLDTSGVIAARTQSPERFIGRKGPPELRAAMARAGSGVIETVNGDGVPVFAAFSRSEDSNWDVVIGIPIAELSGQLYAVLLLCGAAAVVLLGVSIALAHRQAARIAHAVQDLIPPAVALGRGEMPSIPQLQVQEADDVAQAIGRASRLLRRRTVERDRAQQERQAAESDKHTATDAYQRIEAVNTALEEFAYAASHDLKAPLRVIDNASKWLEEDLCEHLTGENRENMNLLRGRVARMEKLLDDLLEYSRLGHESDGPSQEIVSGDVLMDDILVLLSPPQGFTVKTSPAFAGIQVRRMPLQQVLMNLISNAIKHHDHSTGSVEVTVEDRGADYAFAVKDDGPGIPARFHDQIFKMFHTLKPRDQVEGSGMGLAMVRKSVAVGGGTLTLESSEGQGSLFRFTWPKQQKSRREAA